MADEQDPSVASTPKAGRDAPAGADKQREPMYGEAYRQKRLELLQRCQADARQNIARQARDRADLLNLRMTRGGEDNQWLVWDGMSNTYITRPTDGDAGLPQWFFRASSNFLANKVDGNAAILNQSQPSKNWYATKDDDQSRVAAEVAELADPVLLDEIDYPHALRPRLNKLACLTNLAAVILTYDTDPKWGMEQLPLLLCQNPDCRQIVNPMDAPNGPDGQAPEDVCPDCGAPLDFAPDPRDPSGTTPLGMDYPKGRLDAELVSSFEVSMPRTAAMALEDRLPWLATHQRWSSEEAISRWPALGKVLTPGKSTGSRASEQAYADQMRFLSAPVSPNSAQNVAGTAVATGPVIWRFWHDPIEDDDFYFPAGLFLTVLEGEDQELDAGPLPFKDDDGRPFKNIVIRQFAAAPGSPWGKPPADDLVPLQKQLNLAQSLAFLILMHHATPRTFVPSTVTLHDKTSGMPGTDIGFTALRPGDKPVTEPGQGFPEALKWFIEFIIQTFDTISKLNAVLMGERPQGDPTLGEVEILQERGFAAFQEPLEQLVAFEKRLSLKLLWIARQSAWAPRFRRLLNEENGNWELKQFTGADLEGHYTVDIELASAWPKSPMLTNLRLQKAIELQILNPADPEVQEQYLRLNDLQDFKKSNDVDAEQIARQLDVWRQAQQPQQIEPPQRWWRLDMHLFRKSQFLKSELFEQIRQANPAVAQAMLQHVMQLQLLLQPPAPVEGAAPAKGDRGTLDRATASGALHPSPGPGARGALDRATQSRALQPAGTRQAQATHARKQAGPAINRAIASRALTPARPQVPTTSNPAGARA